MSTTDLRTRDFAAPASIIALRTRALAVGVIAAIVAAVGAFVSPDQFFRGYLMGYMWTLGLALGCMILLMTGHMTGGQWWLLTRRIFEAGTRTLPLMAILFVPIAIGMFTGHLYSWTHAEMVHGDKVLIAKAPYLNETWWLIRAVIWLGIWNLLSYLLNKWSAQQDVDTNPNIWRRLKVVSGIGLVVYAFTITFASVDWVMSLDAHWFSTIYGMLYMIGHLMSGLAFSIIMLTLLARERLFREIVTPSRLHDLGKLLLAFVMVWAYFSFSQFLIIWMANLPDEISWFLDRIKGGWGIVALFLIFAQFALPFTLLLSRDLKRDTSRLVPVALLLIFMRLVDMYWLIVPNPLPAVKHVAGEGHFLLHWTHIVAPVALLGIWFAAYLWYLAQRPLLVRQEPMLPKLWEPSHGH